MPKAYSEDLRRRIVADTGKGLSIRALAGKYSVSPSFVSKITSLWRQEGSVRAKRVGGYKLHALDKHADAIRRKLAVDKGVTLQDLRDWAFETLGVRVHLSSVIFRYLFVYWLKVVFCRSGNTFFIMSHSKKSERYGSGITIAFFSNKLSLYQVCLLSDEEEAVIMHNAIRPMTTC